MKNNRTFLEKLLDGSEVEWKPLDEVANIVNNARKPVKSSSRVSGNIPYYGANNIQDYVEGYTHEGEFVLIAEDGSASLENYSIQWAVGKFWANNHVHVVNGKEKLNNRFLYHYLTNMNFIPFLAGKERAKLTKAKLQQIPIPIPPLSVQTEIVKILDALTALTSELTSELILRQKQYEYYREKLLSEEELGKVGFEWKTIDEISKKISSGGTPTTSNNGYYDNGTIPWLRTQEVDFKEIWDTNIKITEDALNNSSAKWIPANCVIVAMYGATVGKTAINKIPLTTNQACANIEINDKLACYRYIFHYLTSKYEYIKSLGSGSQTNINAQIIKKLKVPVPPIEEQYRIVSILDKFETLTNSITEGLPLAIEQSQKRYEYYRELLLNFPSRE
ncbi:TPA: restriction endonuclease subunit S [Haemophilus influenzae]|uniref:Restriction endonuclease subunit S n=2 Tax=Haemophilus influenzae TaxID=727 RepID=A0A3E1QGI5_HAEIF|nr:restriction endonuclease subunit S [Haemophilus influenzae]AAX87274.1 putative type I restriction-modification system specificity protein [Haemophilus influenzae 86-028NP]AJO89538.1 Type I restriction enzyme specificity protein [Haemophilus influenzae]AVJ06099.1 type-1 restriction enzyme MjaXIP specificity domain protein [Haemophilus influenzae]AVJ07932.1 type-1 restriction enzyme MjaXIP specificity domain protein [Haemophilus influenzae]EEP45443.1 putative type I restriction-modification s